MRQNLIIVRAGDGSLHPKWLQGGVARNFDIFISCFEEDQERLRTQCEHYEAFPGLKWPRLAQLLQERQELLFAYDACWFPDDDLDADTPTINRMFEVFHAHDLWLAQPALGPGSHLSHRITAAVSGGKLRFTDFVEVMCPIFSRHALTVLGPSFAASVSGWGLDFLWPQLLDYPEDRIAILDETPVLHARPVGSGGLYEKFTGLGVDPREEARLIVEKHHLFKGPRVRVYQSISASES